MGVSQFDSLPDQVANHLGSEIGKGLTPNGANPSQVKQGPGGSLALLDGLDNRRTRAIDRDLDGDETA